MMKIELDHIDELSECLSDKHIVLLQSRYLEYPKNNDETEGVLQRHCIGDSCHFDFRVLINDHLVGFSIVGFSRENDPKIDDLKINVNYRSETKSSQPIDWLFKNKSIGEEFEFKPGNVGAGVEKSGYMMILDRLVVKLGSLKPYFLEYFIKGDRYFKDWTRIVFTAIKAKRLDPETKQPTGSTERVWIFKIPNDQIPYCISDRAMKKNWIPPKGIIPFPIDWVKDNFKDQYDKWSEWINKSELSLVNYAYVMVSWIGSRAISGRNLPQYRNYLIIQDRDDSAISYIVDGNLLTESYLTVFEFDRVPIKWLTYEGLIDPDTVFNPNKEIKANYKILSKGKLDMDITTQDGIKMIHLDFKTGLINGKWLLKESEKGSDIMIIQQLNTIDLTTTEFVFQKHTIKDSYHYDIRFKNGLEFNLESDPLDDHEVVAYKKKCYDIDKWFFTDSRDMNIGNIPMHIDTLDHGKAEIINDSELFTSFKLYGNQLNGYYVCLRTDGSYVFKRSDLPSESLSAGDPLTGEYYDPFKIVDIKGRDTFRIELYDLKNFTRCEPIDKSKLYYDNIPDGVSLGICLFPRENKIHGARVSYVIFERDKWTIDDAIKWIKSNKIHRLLFDMVKECMIPDHTDK